MTQADDSAKLPKQITVWACPECGYWRQERSTGVHVFYPSHGKGVRHELVEATYMRAPYAVEADALRERLGLS